jgi:hypothetical protein
MKTWARKTLAAGVLAAGALLLAPAAAQAAPPAPDQVSGQNFGALSGNQILADVAVPVNVIGTSIGAAGESWATGQGVNFVEAGKKKNRGNNAPSQVSGQNFGLGSGNQLLVPVKVPVNVVGTSVSVLGYSTAQGAGVNHVEEKGHKGDNGRGGAPDQLTGNNFGALSGNQAKVPVQVPVNVCGTSLGILGMSTSQAACGNHLRPESGEKQLTGANYGLGSGNQALIPIAAPINLTGTSAAVGGFSSSTAASGNDLESGNKGGKDAPDQVSGQNFGALSGNQAKLPIQIPINACGTSIAVLGYSQSAAGCANDLGDGKGGKGHGGNWGGGQNNGGNNGGQHGGGHHGGNNGGQGPDNAGDNGENPDDDGDYLGDNGENPDDNGGDKGGYGSSNPRTMKSQEGAGLGQLNGGLSNLGGLSLLGGK